MQPPHPPGKPGKLLGHPFFQRYGVNLPSSLTEGHSFTWGELPLPTSVGLRYGRFMVWREAFLDGLAPHTSVGLLRLGTDLTLVKEGFASPSRLVRCAHPVHSMGCGYLPRPLFARNDLNRCRTLHLLAIAYDVMSSA